MSKGSRRSQLDAMRKIRKPMPPPGRVIRPKSEDDEKFDWRKIDDDDGYQSYNDKFVKD